MKERKVTIAVVIEEGSESFHYKDSITTDNIIAAVDFYNKTLNQLDEVNYNDFPLFKDECQEVDYHNQHTDFVADTILEHINNPIGRFGSDKLNKIVDLFHEYKQTNKQLRTILIILFICLIAAAACWNLC